MLGVLPKPCNKGLCGSVRLPPHRRGQQSQAGDDKLAGVTESGGSAAHPQTHLTVASRALCLSPYRLPEPPERPIGPIQAPPNRHPPSHENRLYGHFGEGGCTTRPAARNPRTGRRS